MIQANELRIGNLVRQSGSNNPYMVTLERFWEHYNTADAFYYLEPIPLTEEILLKCGFDLIGTSYFIKSLPCIYFSKPYFEAEHLLVKSNGGDKITSVNSIHQLQNLYFALTGQELNIEL